MRSLLKIGAIGICVLLALGGSLALSGAASAQNPEPAGDPGKAALVAGSANLDAFSFCTLRFRRLTANAKSEEAALKGEYLNAVSSETRVLKDGKTEVQEGFAADPDVKFSQPVPGQKGVYRLATNGYSGKYLSDGARDLSYSRALRCVNLASFDLHRPSPQQTPLTLCAELFRLRDDEDYDYRFQGFEEILGKPVVTVKFWWRKARNMPEGPLIESKLVSLDPAQGYLPLRVITYWNDKKEFVYYLLKVRSCSRGRWYPEQFVSIYQGARPGADVSIIDYLVTELDVDRRPDPADFNVALPAGTSVLERGNATGKSFRFKQDEKIGLAELPNLFTMLDKVGAEPLMDTAVPPAPWSWWRWLGLFAGVVVAGCGLAHLWRRYLGRPVKA